MKRRDGPKRRVTSRPDRYRVDPWVYVILGILSAAFVGAVVMGLIVEGKI